MKKLELELFRYDRLVFGKVLYQDEELRGQSTLGHLNDFVVKSKCCPELMDNTLFVRGTTGDLDSDVFFYRFQDKEEAKNVVRKIKKIVAEINEEDLAPGGSIVKEM